MDLYNIICNCDRYKLSEAIQNASEFKVELRLKDEQVGKLIKDKNIKSLQFWIESEIQPVYYDSMLFYVDDVDVFKLLLDFAVKKKYEAITKDLVYSILSKERIDLFEILEQYHLTYPDIISIECDPINKVSVLLLDYVMNRRAIDPKFDIQFDDNILDRASEAKDYDMSRSISSNIEFLHKWKLYGLNIVYSENAIDYCDADVFQFWLDLHFEDPANYPIKYSKMSLNHCAFRLNEHLLDKWISLVRDHNIQAKLSASAILGLGNWIRGINYDNHRDIIYKFLDFFLECGWPTTYDTYLGNFAIAGNKPGLEWMFEKISEGKLQLNENSVHAFEGASERDNPDVLEWLFELVDQGKIKFEFSERCIDRPSHWCHLKILELWHKMHVERGFEFKYSANTFGEEKGWSGIKVIDSVIGFWSNHPEYKINLNDCIHNYLTYEAWMLTPWLSYKGDFAKVVEIIRKGEFDELKQYHPDKLKKMIELKKCYDEKELQIDCPDELTEFFGLDFGGLKESGVLELSK